MIIVKNISVLQVFQIIPFRKVNFFNINSIINRNNSKLVDDVKKKFFSSNVTQKDLPVPDNQSLNERNNSIVLKLPDNKIITTTLLQAKEMTITKELELIQINDGVKGNKPLYKLVSKITDEPVDNVKEAKAFKKKDAKHIRISSNISDHDLKVKIKFMLGFLQKNLKVTTVIYGKPNPSKLDEVANTIINELQPVAMKPKQTKEKSGIKILFTPRTDNQDKENNSKDLDIQETKRKEV